MGNKISGIYVIVNTKNGKVYVGQAVDFKTRWKNHRCRLNSGRHDNKHLQAAWKKYGAASFKFLKLEYCNIEQLIEREQHYVDIYRAKGIAYNIAGDVRAPMRGRSPSKETRRKMSDALKGNKNSLGVFPNEETRRKLSELAKNRPPISDETRRKISEASKGNKHCLGRILTEETRRKMSESAKNKTVSEEAKRNLREANKGNKYFLGKTHSEEARRKMSEAATLRHARKRAEREVANQAQPTNE